MTMIDLAAAGNVLQNLCPADVDLDHLELAYLKHRSTGPVLAVLEAPTTNGTTASFTARWVDREKGRRLEARLNAHRAALAPALSTPSPPPVYCEDQGLLFTAFPTDRRLTSLPLSADADQMLARLRPVLEPAAAVALSKVVARPIRYKPDSKCVMRFDLTWAGPSATAPPTIFGKVAKPSAFHRSRGLLSLLHDASFDPGFTIPEPLGSLDDLSLELFTAVPGIPLASVPANDDPVEIGARVGRALARFHSFPAALPTRAARHDRIELLTDNANQLTNLLPKRAHDATQLSDEIVRRLRSEPVVSSSVTHGDFHAGNVLVHQSRLGLVDFEDVAMGDPADDVGSMFAHLTELALCAPNAGSSRSDPALATRAAFLAGYGAGPAISRVATHAALHCVLRSYQALRHPGPSAPWRSNRLLDESRRILEGTRQ